MDFDWRPGDLGILHDILPHEIGYMHNGRTVEVRSCIYFNIRGELTVQTEPLPCADGYIGTHCPITNIRKIRDDDDQKTASWEDCAFKPKETCVT